MLCYCLCQHLMTKLSVYHLKEWIVMKCDKIKMLSLIRKAVKH